MLFRIVLPLRSETLTRCQREQFSKDKWSTCKSCVASESGGEGRIRTFGTGLNGVRADVCVTSAESTGSEILQQTAWSPFDTLNSPVSRKF